MAVGFVECLVELVRLGARVDQPRGQPQRVGRGRRETEPAGVGRQGDKRRLSNLGRQRHAQLVGRRHDQPSGRLGIHVLEQFGPQVVAANVMIEHDLDGFGCSDDVGHRSQLGPGGRVEDDQHLAVLDLRGGHVHAQLPKLLVRVEKLQVRRDGERVAHPDILAEALQDGCQGELAAQGIAIRPDMGRQREPLMAADDFDEAGPIYHGCILSAAKDLEWMHTADEILRCAQDDTWL